MRLFAPALLLLLACDVGPPPTCVTKCGLASWSIDQCDQFQEAEDRALKYLPALFNTTQEQACATFRSVNVINKDTPEGWYNPFLREVVYGETYCEYRTVEIQIEPSFPAAKPRFKDVPLYSSLVHELGHVIDGCVHDHDGWEEKGIYAAIRTANSD